MQKPNTINITHNALLCSQVVALVITHCAVGQNKVKGTQNGDSNSFTVKWISIPSSVKQLPFFRCKACFLMFNKHNMMSVYFWCRYSAKDAHELWCYPFMSGSLPCAPVQNTGCAEGTMCSSQQCILISILIRIYFLIWNAPRAAEYILWLQRAR